MECVFSRQTPHRKQINLSRVATWRSKFDMSLEMLQSTMLLFRRLRHSNFLACKRHVSNSLIIQTCQTFMKCVREWGKGRQRCAQYRSQIRRYLTSHSAAFDWDRLLDFSGLFWSQQHHIAQAHLFLAISWNGGETALLPPLGSLAATSWRRTWQPSSLLRAIDPGLKASFSATLFSRGHVFYSLVFAGTAILKPFWTILGLWFVSLFFPTWPGSCSRSVSDSSSEFFFGRWCRTPYSGLVVFESQQPLQSRVIVTRKFGTFGKVGNFF